MDNILEAAMIVSFGISWPFNIYKLWKSKTTRGVSLFFYFFIWAGYIAGIVSKIIKLSHGIAVPAYVMVFYVLNFVMLSSALVLYFRNKRLEKEN